MTHLRRTGSPRPTSRVTVGQAPSKWRAETAASVLRQRSALIGLVILVTFALVAIFADQLSPYHPQRTSWASREPVPGPRPVSTPWAVPRSIGSTGSGSMATAVTCIRGSSTAPASRSSSASSPWASAILVGALLGAIAGYAGGRIDTLIMRLMDVLLVFPALILAIAIVTVVGPGLLQAASAIGLVAIPVYARIMRASVLTVREQDFVTASRALGESPWSLLTRRVLPNSLTAILVAGTLGIGSAVLDIAALSFLGLGADIRTPEWGAMIGNESSNVFSSPHLLLFPGIALTMTVLAYNLFGDGLRDALDPRLHR